MGERRMGRHRSAGVAIVVVCFLWVFVGLAPAADYAVLKGQLKVLEAVLDETLAQTFERPFGLLENAKGTYLPTYGAVFTVEVNLYPVRVPNPFDSKPLSKEEIAEARRVKLERMQTIKRLLPRLLADHASSLRELGSQDSVAIIVYLFHFQAEGEKLPTQLVLQIKKEDLDQFQARKLSFEELVTRMKVLEL